jgi:glycosyltransferase involved in cell wall biosynthesis
MRLLFVIDSLVAGGAQRQLTSLAVELVRRGHAVDLFAYHHVDHFGEEMRAGGVRMMIHRKRSRYSFSPAWELRKLFREGGYDVALSYLPVPNFYCLVAAAGLRQRPKIVVSERSFPIRGFRGFKKRILERFYPRADHITTNAHHMRAHYRKRYGWGDNRVTTIWNGLDLKKFSATPLVRRPGEPLKLLCIGRVDRNKAWHLIGEAAGLLKERRGTRIRVTVVGRKDPILADEFTYRGELRGVLERHGIDGDWEFVGQRSDIAQLFATHHALAHPSIVEGLSNVVCESLACGRPVVVADAFDHRALVRNGETGWLFEQNSIQSLADALRKVDEMTPEALANMGAKARRFAEEHLTITRLADEYEALFERLVGGGGNRQSRGATHLDERAVVETVRDA